MRPISLLVVGTLVAALPQGRAAAQFFSLEPFVSGSPSAAEQNRDNGSGSSGNPLGLLPAAPARSLFTLAAGGTTGESIRTVQGGHHVGDLYGGARTLSGSVVIPRAKGLRFSAFTQAGNRQGILVDSGRRRTDGSLYTDALSVRATLPVFPARSAGYVFVGYDRANARFDGATDALNNALPLFGQARPDVAWRYRRAAVVLGVEGRVGRTTLSAAAGRFDSSGGIHVSHDANRVLLPLGHSGGEWRADIRAPLASGEASHLLLWAENAAGKGTASPTLNEQSVGGTANSRASEKAVGLAWERRYGIPAAADAPSDKEAATILTFFHARRWARLQTDAFGMSARALGFSNVDLAGYDLAVSLDNRTTGVTWQRSLPHDRYWTLDYRWVETPMVARYGYSGSRFFLFLHNGGEWSSRNARGHRLAASYSLPLRSGVNAPRVLLNAAQVIPMSIQSKTVSERGNSGGGSSNPVGASAEPRRGRGGWEVSAAIAISIR